MKKLFSFFLKKKRSNSEEPTPKKPVEKVAEKPRKPGELMVGDSVQVKEGIKDVDDENIDLSGWQGRIQEINDFEGEKVVLIQWDSHSLKKMDAIEDCIRNYVLDGMDYENYNLSMNEVERTEPQDTPQDVERVQNIIHRKYTWVDSDYEDIIEEVLEDIDYDFTAFEAWEEYLSDILTLPFWAKIEEDDNFYSKNIGKKVKVLAFEDIDDLRGIIVKVSDQNGVFYFPLCNLASVKESHELSAYVEWFANR